MRRPYTPSKLHIMETVVALGTGAVATQARLLGTTPRRMKVIAINFVGAAAVTGTSLTGMVRYRSADGNSTTDLMSAAKDLKITSSNDNVEQQGVLATSGLTVPAGRAVECVFTATSITAGPGDVVVQVVCVPVQPM